MVGTFKSLFKGNVAQHFITKTLLEQFVKEKENSPLAADQPPKREFFGGPVAKIARGTFERRLTPWEPDPARPDTHLRAFHYTKGWRYRKDLSQIGG